MNPIALLLYGAGALYLYKRHKTKATSSGKKSAGGHAGGDPSLPHWITNGIRFTYEPLTQRLTAEYTDPDKGPVTDAFVGTYATQEAAYAASLGWLPPFDDDGDGGAGGGGGDLPPELPHWVHNGILFTYHPDTGELIARHSQGLTGQLDEPVDELVGTYDTQQAAYAASLGWMPFGQG